MLLKDIIEEDGIEAHLNPKTNWPIEAAKIISQIAIACVQAKKDRKTGKELRPTLAFIISVFLFILFTIIIIFIIFQNRNWINLHHYSQIHQTFKSIVPTLHQ